MSLLQKRGRRASLGLKHRTVRFQLSRVFSVLIASVSFLVHSSLSHFNSFLFSAGNQSPIRSLSPAGFNSIEDGSDVKSNTGTRSCSLCLNH